MEFINLIINIFCKNDVPEHLKVGFFLIAIGLSLFLFIRKNWNFDEFKFILPPNQRYHVIERSNFANNLANKFARRFDPKIIVETYVQNKGSLKKQSLSKAIRRSREQLVILEGRPGSGKTAGLNQYAYKLATIAAKPSNSNFPLPVYIDLKDFPLVLEHISPNLLDRTIQKFILKTLFSDNGIEVTDSIKHDFEEGLRNKGWFFIFDSFDEIPNLLISKNKDQAIRKYFEAINRFLGRFNNCKGILASRYYSGPYYSNLPILIIQPLTSKQIISFIQNFKVSENIQNNIIIGIENAKIEINKLVQIPLFLQLLCKNLENHHEFPQNLQTFYEDYIISRLNNFDNTLQKKFDLTRNQLCNANELIAFTMIQENLGLNPTRSELIKALQKNGGIRLSKINNFLDALIQINLLFQSNVGDDSSSHESKICYFHRRIQEYLAMQFINNDVKLHNTPSCISASEMLSDGRWREVTVLFLQIQDSDRITFLFDEIFEIIKREFWNICKNLSFDYEIKFRKTSYESMRKKVEIPKDNQCYVIRLSNSHSMQYLLEIILDGLINKIQIIPGKIINFFQLIIWEVYWNYSIQERFFALQFIGLLDDVDRKKIFQDIGKYTPEEIINIAAENAVQINELTDTVKIKIIQKILENIYSGRFSRGKHSLEAFLEGNPITKSEKRNLASLKYLPFIDALLLLLVTLWFFAISPFLGLGNLSELLVWANLMNLVISLLILFRSSFFWQKDEKFQNIFRSIYFGIRIFWGTFMIFGGVFFPILIALLIITVGWTLELKILTFLWSTFTISAWSAIIIPSLASLSKHFGRTLHPKIWFFSPLVLAIVSIRKKIGDIITEFAINRSFIKIKRLEPTSMSGYKKFIKAIFNYPRRKVFQFLEVLGLLILFSICGYVYFWFYIPTYIFDIFYKILTHLPIFLFIALGCLFLINYLSESRIEKNLYSHLKSNINLSINELLEWFLPEKSNKAEKWRGSVNLVLHVVLSNRKLEVTPQALDILERLAVLIQCSQNMQTDSITFTLKPNHVADLFDQWLIKFQDLNKKGISSFNRKSLNILNNWLTDYFNQPDNFK